MCHLVPGPLPCPEVVAVFYIRPAEVPTLSSVERDAQVEQQNTVARFLTAIVTNRGLFKPRVMYFGMTNSPATFQALMNSVFADLIAKGQVAVYMDDILIYSKDIKAHRLVVRESS